MSLDQPLVLVLCALALLLAGSVKGTLGIGMPLVAVPLMSLLVPVPVAVALLPMPILLANLWQAFAGGYFVASVRRFWPVIISLVVGVLLGARLLASLDRSLLYLVVGVGVIVFSLSGRFAPGFRLSARAERPLGVLAGFLAGTVGGISTMYGPVLVPYLVALRLPKDEFVGAIGTLYLIGIVPLLAAFAGFGLMGPAEFAWSSAAVVPVAAGVVFGQWLRRHVDQQRFARAVLTLLLFTGASLVWRALA